MPKKNRDNNSEAPDDEPGRLESIGKRLDENPKLQAAGKAVDKVRSTVEDAVGKVQDARKKATQRVQSVRNKRIGEMIDDTLDYVKENPAKGLCGASALGFLLGWILRRK